MYDYLFYAIEDILLYTINQLNKGLHVQTSELYKNK